jgi:hypothetical protein
MEDFKGHIEEEEWLGSWAMTGCDRWLGRPRLREVECLMSIMMASRIFRTFRGIYVCKPHTKKGRF